MAPKTLLVFCDGTGMDGSLGPPKAPAPTASQDSPQLVLDADSDIPPVQGGGGSAHYITNVLRLARSVHSVDKNGNKQIVFYQSGVGSEADFKGDPVTGTTPMQLYGTAVASKIRDAYVFIAQNYEVGDEICLFGFSRGAYTARKLSGLIDSIGLLTRQNLGLFFGIWRQLMNHDAPSIPSDTRRVDIKCVGVWDTVGAVDKEIDALNITDTSLPATVKVALHAVSMQENRKKFLPTLWTIPSGGLKPGQVLKQMRSSVWFAGAHSDVGGGYERHELADIALFWMAGEIKSLINLDLDFLRSYAQIRPDPWGTSQPHNAYKETPLPFRPFVGHETRLESHQITPQSVFHQSIMYSPAILKSPEYMTTMKLITDSFGPGFAPQYPALNEFEQYCKDHWDTGLRTSPGDIDDPWIVIRPQWISPVDGFVPLSAIVGGQETHGDLLYVARASYQGGIHPGKASPQYGNVFISFDGKEIEFPLTSDDIEVLVGDQLSVRWAPVSGQFSLDQLDGAVPVPGGNEADGTCLYVAQAEVQNGVHCGEVKVNDTARIPWGGQQEFATEYEVLVYA